LHRRRTLILISQEINALHAYFFIVSYPDFVLLRYMPRSRRRTSSPRCVDVLTQLAVHYMDTLTRPLLRDVVVYIKRAVSR
jgi:hypothetical protein